MAEKILIIDDDVDTLKLVGMMLQKQGYKIIASANGKQGLMQAEAENPDLILLDVMLPEMDGFQVAKHLRANALTVDTPILMFTAKAQLDDKVTGFEAGADDYLTKPTHPTELRAHVKALLARSSKGKISTSELPAEKPATIIGVLAPRGGQGVSTVAVNLGDALQSATKSEVIVAELRPGMGTLGPDLGETNPNVLTELLSTDLSEISHQKIQEKLYTLPSGLHVLFGSVQARDGLMVNAPERMEALVNHMSYLTPYLVLDLGAGLRPMIQKLLPMCNILLVLVEPVMNSVIYSKALITDLADLMGGKQNIHAIVVNRIRSDTQLTMTQMEEILGKTPLIAITPAPELIYTAARMKTTAFAANPDSLTTQQFTKLAESVIVFEKQKI
ncbi:MAG: response regulator [Anaerolineales bacterium]|jgi:DNA-binding response OmpR family regulator/CO dehydrogenase nickel-insertion accessory protein CooC1